MGILFWLARWLQWGWDDDPTIVDVGLNCCNPNVDK
jgi:hypothetical protein